MADIILSNGKRVKVDDKDYRDLNRLHWYESGGSAVTSYFEAGKKITIYMQRYLLGFPPGDKRIAANANGDKLDNRRSNIRISSKSEIAAKRKPLSSNTSGFRGVSETRCGQWKAQITVMRRSHYLGTFKTAVEASRAYKKAEKELKTNG